MDGSIKSRGLRKFSSANPCFYYKLPHAGEDDYFFNNPFARETALLASGA